MFSPIWDIQIFQPKAMINPYQVTILFEEAIASYCGSKYAVATESCTSSLFLCLMYRKHIEGDIGRVVIPSRTYPGVACSVLHAGGRLDFDDKPWEGEYELGNTLIWDAALRFKRGMFRGKPLGAMQCLSFHIKKNLPIGRGSVILTDEFEAVKWLRKARFDGRNPVPLQDDVLDMLGWNMYLQPDQAARGLQLLQALGDRELPDLEVSKQGYPDLSQFKIYTQ